MASVHFWGVDSVVKAYEQRNVDSWAVFQGSKQMLNKGDNKEDLKTYLETLWQDSTAIFTLNFYECSVDEVKPTSQNDGSFNFKISEHNHGTTGASSDRLILSELNALKLKIAELESEDETDDDNDPDLWEKISGILEKPAVVGLINRLAGTNIQPAKIGTIPPGDNSDLILKAVEILKTKDPRLGEHLMKLATMATNTPDNFTFLLSTLDSM